MPNIIDGPASPLFAPIRIPGNCTIAGLADAQLSRVARDHCSDAPTGSCVLWGIPFDVKRVRIVNDAPVRMRMNPSRAPWLVFMHTTDFEPVTQGRKAGIPAGGEGRLAEPVADYVFGYADGSEHRHTIRRRHEIGMLQRRWGENCFQAVAHHQPRPQQPPHESPIQSWQVGSGLNWGSAQTRNRMPDISPWVNWLWAWENPFPQKDIVSLRIEPINGTLLLFGLSAGQVASNPLRRSTRQKVVLKLPRGQEFDAVLDGHGQNRHVQIDLGSVISVAPRTIYPNRQWTQSFNNERPEIAKRELLVEFTAHEDARFYFANGKSMPIARINKQTTDPITPIAPASQRVDLRVIDKRSKRPVAVKLHVHGEAGEYLAPIDRHRIPNAAWFEDYGPEYVHSPGHFCTYIPGETSIDLPLGRVYIEVSKGFEIRPVREVYSVTRATKRITITLDAVLPWRERGWVTADTHVHFLSPATAQLEGAAEGVNVINLLASQWGELMTNVGDFDGKTTFGSKEAGGDGEWLVRVGTENRQHVLGHISLLGYRGKMITPLTTGGPDESALGDPVDVLMSEWARQCRKQGGLVVMPHFPDPRCENAANLINGEIDAVEMCSWGDLYGGIDPYSLADWYRYLNCGIFVPAVGGTDKMAASTPVGAIRTYARLGRDTEFSYEAWMEAVKTGNTFATYGPLLEFSVEGKPAGCGIRMRRSGGEVDVVWEAASVTMPMTRVELVVNGEIRESLAVNGERAAGQWRLKLARSSWLALLVRGQYPGHAEVIAAHTSAVSVKVGDTPFFAPADAVTILEQIEGALAYLDTIATRASGARYKQMRLTLTAAHRKLHNELHRYGHDHRHVLHGKHKH